MTTAAPASGRPVTFSRLDIVQDFQPALDACDELKYIAIQEGLRHLAVKTREKLIELLLDRLLLQGPIEQYPNCYSQICESEKYQRILREKPRLEKMITQKVHQARRQVIARRANNVTASVKASGPPRPETPTHDGSNRTQFDWHRSQGQGRCTMADTRRIYCWLGKLDPNQPSEIPRSPLKEEVTWDFLY